MNVLEELAQRQTTRYWVVRDRAVVALDLARNDHGGLYDPVLLRLHPRSEGLFATEAHAQNWIDARWRPAEVTEWRERQDIDKVLRRCAKRSRGT